MYVFEISDYSKLGIICNYPITVGRTYFLKCVHTLWKDVEFQGSANERKGNRRQKGREIKNR